MSVYRPILRVRQAYAFDAGGFLMRIYTCMVPLGTISMTTLTGYSFLMAGMMASCTALATLLISPALSRQMDKRGQGKVVPWATLACLGGLAVLILGSSHAAPMGICCLGAILMGCCPRAQALCRARWSYLIREHGLCEKGATIKAAFSYEGILDDLSYMIGPAAAIALAAEFSPYTGMLSGGVMLLAGAALISLSKSTEPPAWEEVAGMEKDAKARPNGSLMRQAPAIGVVFALLALAGVYYGILDTGIVAFAQEQGNPSLASAFVAPCAIASAISGLAFGALRTTMPLSKQLLLACGAVGVLYALLFFFNSTVPLLIVYTVAACSWAPFIITANTLCESIAPKERLNEAMTWVGVGYSCGMSFAPTIGGALVDSLGSMGCIDAGAAAALLIPAVALISYRTLKAAEARDPSNA